MGAMNAILGCFLLAQVGQVGAAGPSIGPAAGSPMPGVDAESPLQPIRDSATAGVPSQAERSESELEPEPNHRAALPSAGDTATRKDPPQLVKELLALPEGSPLAGRPLTLLEAVAAARDPAARLAVTHAYWDLTQALGDYRSLFDEQQVIASLSGRAGEDVFLRSARAAALAARKRAQMAAVVAQQELAEAAGFSADDPLPLPADLPHVGPYRTRLDEILLKQPVPSRTRLINRTLPIGRRVIDLRAAAVDAEKEALDAAVDAYRRGRAGLSPVLVYAAEWGRQRRALVASVCRYNRDIAEYCLAVVGPGTDARALVAMLITGGRDAAGPAGRESSGVGHALATEPAAGEPSAVEPATLNTPIGDGSRVPSRPLSVGEPTLAPPRELAEPAAAVETPAAPREIPPSVDTLEAAPIPSGEEGEPPEVPVSERPLVPVVPPPSPPGPRTARRPMIAPEEALPPAAGLYPALVGKEPAVQAKQLAAVLHWFRLLPEPAGEPVTLRECLRAVLAADRREAVARYWLASQRAAEYQARIVENNLLQELTPWVTAAGAEQDASVDARRLSAARSAAEAELLDARRAFLESQFELARTLGRPLDAPGPLPTTSPHCGPYLLRLDMQPGRVVASWPLRRVAATIPAMADGLECRATAVVEADSSRAAATEAYPSGGRSLDPVLHAMRHQTGETLAFLETLGNYNRAIAEYALTVLPPGVSEDRLVRTLVRE